MTTIEANRARRRSRKLRAFHRPSHRRRQTAIAAQHNPPRRDGSSRRPAVGRPASIERDIQEFLDEYRPATPAETQLVNDLANTAWRLNRIPFLEADLLTRAANPTNEQAAIAFDIVATHRRLASLGLDGDRLSRHFRKTLEQLRSIQTERRERQRRELREAVDLPELLKYKGLLQGPSSLASFFQR